MMSWNSMVINSTLGLIVFLNRITKKAEDAFKFVKGLIEEVPDLEMPEVIIDRTHRIGPDYTNKKTESV